MHTYYVFDCIQCSSPLFSLDIIYFIFSYYHQFIIQLSILINLFVKRVLFLHNVYNYGTRLTSVYLVNTEIYIISYYKVYIYISRFRRPENGSGNNFPSEK